MDIFDTKHSRTSNEGRRILSAIADCDRFIAKESPRRADLRPADIQKTLDFYVAHRARLVAALED